MVKLFKFLSGSNVIAYLHGENMIHPDRTFCIKVMYAEYDLVEVTTNHKWSLCRAFEHEGLLYLNDGGGSRGCS